MDPREALLAYAEEEISRGLGQIDAATAQDVYALSFLVYDADDDPRRPTLTVGYNTVSHAREQASRASDAAEARWNYAFWLQNQICTVGDEGSKGAQLWKATVAQMGFAYTDAGWEADIDKCLALGEKMTATFVTLAVNLARKLHDTGAIRAKFGRPVPVIVHELEYYDEIAAQTERANPPGVAKEFCDWVRNL